MKKTSATERIGPKKLLEKGGSYSDLPSLAEKKPFVGGGEEGLLARGNGMR